jgi:Tol biopolymer transport system component
MKKLQILLIVTVMLVGYQIPLQAQNGEKLFREGMMKEEGAGKLDEAIDFYYKVVNDVSAKRSLRAKALMHVGICYEKLGKKNAQSAYEKLIAEYADQTAIVAMVRKKLRSLKVDVPKELNSGMITQHIKNFQLFSPDNMDLSGRYYTYENWLPKSKELMYFDMLTGKTDSITEGSTWLLKNWNWPYGSVWSPDSKRVAYMWEAEKQLEVRISNLHRSNTQTIIKGTNNFDVPKIKAYSPDGNYLVGTMQVNAENEKHQKLVLISIANKNFKVLKDFGNRFAKDFQFSPNGKHIIFSRRRDNSVENDLYSISLNDNTIVQITQQKGDTYNPVWKPDGSAIVFLSDELGTVDLYKKAIKNGKSVGQPVLVKRNLGKKVRIMIVAPDQSLFYVTKNQRFDIFTIAFDEQFNTENTKTKRITDLTLKYGGKYPGYSKDGRYISYRSLQSNAFNQKKVGLENNLGRKYFINIFDTKTGVHTNLNLDMYVNFPGFGNNWHMLSWSYDSYKFLISARIKKNYESGLFIVDMPSEKFSSVLTSQNDKFGIPNDNVIGHSMHFSRKKNTVYFSAKDWKTYYEYNFLTKEKKEIIKNDDGFWFGEFLDKEENVCVIFNRFGSFKYNINTKKMEKFAEKAQGPYIGSSPDKKYFYLWKEGEIIRRDFKGVEEEKVISLTDLFPGRELDYKAGGPVFHPLENKAVLELKTNSGTDLFKLTNVFN